MTDEEEEFDVDLDEYDWKQWYTEEHHNRVLELLDDSEYITDYIESYDDGWIVVHTPYVCSWVVEDICDYFGLEITGYGPMWEEQSEVWDCIYDHGSTFEITLKYHERCQSPVHPDTAFKPVYYEKVDENDKQF